MTLPDIFGKILNWKLLAGSHKFPGSDGGTCINEAAIVAAGYKYRDVGSADDLPRCFSKPIGQLGIMLNDALGDETRQKLITTVTRFAGSADSLHIEKKRIRFFLEGLMAHREELFRKRPKKETMLPFRWGNSYLDHLRAPADDDNDGLEVWRYELA